MLNLSKKIIESHSYCEKQMEKFLFHHPIIGLLLIVVGMPVFVLLAVAVSSTAVMLPVSWLMGWL